jgi:hypothetical protein
MKTITISVKAEDKYGEQEANRMMKATDAYLVLWDVSQYLRSQLKHGDLTEEQDTVLERLAEKLDNSMAEHGITFNDLS